MVTYYNKRDLVEFGKYILSKKRRDRVIVSYEESLKEAERDETPEALSLEERLQNVYHADIQNWKGECACKV